MRVYRLAADGRRADRGPPTHRASISFVPTTSPIRSCGTQHDQLSVGRAPWQTNPLVRLNYSAAGSPSSPNPRTAWSRSNLARAAGALDCPGGAQDADPGVVRARAEPEVRIHLPPAGSHVRTDDFPSDPSGEARELFNLGLVHALEYGVASADLKPSIPYARSRF